MRTLKLALLGIAILFAPRLAMACTCMDSGPACQAFWKTDAVFDATVDSIVLTTRPMTLEADRVINLSEKLVSLTVSRGWKGVQAGKIDVVTAEDGAACGYDLKPGRRYLVFAYKSPADGKWTVSGCSATREFDGTGEAAAFLASLDQPAVGARVFGTVKAFVRTLDREHSSGERPLETRLHLRGAGQEWTTISKGGSFEFPALAAGPYSLEIEPAPGYRIGLGGRAVELPNDRACARQDYRAEPAGVLTGRVLQHDGKPAARVNIEASTPAVPTHPIYGPSAIGGYSDEQGFFEIRGLPPGDYIVGVNLSDLPSDLRPIARTIYPSDRAPGRVFSVGTDALDIGTWTLPPPLPVVKLSGVAVWQDGTPAAGVNVSVWDVTNNPVEQARGAGGAITGADGTFTIDVRQGRTYTFMARGKDSRLVSVTGPKVTIEAAAPPVRLVLTSR